MGRIWLIGMMGSGKTTIGAIVAERLQLPLLDTDGMVMERSGRTIPEIFDESEQAFRTLESGVVREAAEGPVAVISTGGGVVLDERNVLVMRRSGVIVLLDASIDELVARIGRAEGRPLYRSRESLVNLKTERSELYAEACDHIVDTNGRSIVDVAEEVIRCVRT